MKTIRLFGLALVAVFAFGAVVASGAFAAEEPAKWLWEGAEIGAGEELAIETVGLLTLMNLSNGGAVHCEGTFDGVVRASGEGLVTAVLRADGTAAQTGDASGLVAGTGVKCLGTGGCAAQEDAELWPDHLPWLTLLFR